MNRFFYVAGTIILGLLTAQVISTLHVRVSNIDLYQTLTAIKKAGYFSVPGQHVAHNLRLFGPAFFGGVFFTMSIGTGLSLVSFAGAWIWDRIFSRKRSFLVFLMVIWMGCLWSSNGKGFHPLVTAYFLFIPPVVFLVTLRWMPPRTEEGAWSEGVVHLIPVALLAILWMLQLDNRMFLDFRDNILLSNSLGIKINDFYYKYTLYPAQVLKTLNQKTLKTCSLEQINKQSTKGLLERGLLNNDYLNTGKIVPADLKIVEEGKLLIFFNNGKEILRTSLKDFLSSPKRVLNEFSLKSDGHAFFRRFTFFSLLTGLPFTLYIFVYALFRFTANFFFNSRTSSVAASILCFFVGLGIIVPFHMDRDIRIDREGLAEALESKAWRERVAALRYIQQNRFEIAEFEAYKNMLSSPNIPERYWLAKTLGVSRRAETYKDLSILLDDSHLNVVCMAFHALGNRKDYQAQAVKELKRGIEISNDWYSQWYAYKALRSLGWKQTRIE